MDTYSLKIDLTLKILSRLPAKSVPRFRCVSKKWASILGTQSFTELFLTVSSAKPRLLFAVAEDGVWSFFSLPQVENPHEKSSSLSAEFLVKFSPGDLLIDSDNDLRYFSCGYASGLIYFYGNRYHGRPVVCNPNTGLYATLPYLHSYGKSYGFFGFEAIDKQYKVVFIKYPFGPGHHKIVTLGTDKRWRKIKCSLRHEVKSQGVCINGVLYYLGDTSDCCHEAHEVITSDYVIVCFDLRSEKFTFIDVQGFCRLVNYNGKLGVIFWEDDVDMYPDAIDSEDDVDIYSEYDVDADNTNELRVWVLEDVEKQEWSKYAYTLSDDEFFKHHPVSVAGVTAWGDIVVSMQEYTVEQPFYVFYFNPERNTLRRVEIQGFGEKFKNLCSVWTFANHVEDLKVNDLKLLKSVHPPFVAPEYSCDSESDS